MHGAPSPLCGRLSPARIIPCSASPRWASKDTGSNGAEVIRTAPALADEMRPLLEEPDPSIDRRDDPDICGHILALCCRGLCEMCSQVLLGGLGVFDKVISRSWDGTDVYGVSGWIFLCVIISSSMLGHCSC